MYISNRASQAKLEEAQVKAIIHQILMNKDYGDLADQYHVSRRTIENIAEGKTWQTTWARILEEKGLLEE